MRAVERFIVPTICLLTLSFWLPHEDGFNVIKFALLLFLGLFSLSLLMVLLRSNIEFLSEHRVYFLIVLTMLLISFFSTLNSDYVWKSFFGEPGRHTGFLTLAASLILGLASGMYLSSQRTSVGLKVIQYLSIVGFIESIYCWIQYFDRDPLKWRVPYGSFVGTLANANFAAAFIGLATVATFYLLLFNKSSIWKDSLVFLALLSQIVLLALSNVRQGLIISLLGIISLLLYRYRKNKKFLFMSLSATLMTGCLTLLGMFQWGPLSSIIYKNSISIRGDYWRAAMRMIADKPIFGFGPGRFGDYFSEYRDFEQASRSSGFVLADSSHNSILDAGVSYGLVFVLFYLSLVFIVLRNVLRSIRKLTGKDKDVLFTILVFYSLFQIQALITVDTLTMYAWSSLFLGILYSSGLRSPNLPKQKEIMSPMRLVLVVVTSLMATAIILNPMWTANSMLREAQMIPVGFSKEQSNAIRANLMNQATTKMSRDSFYFQSAARILISNNQVEGLQYALNAVDLNARDLRSLVMLYVGFSQLGDLERAKTFGDRIKQLDPFSPIK